MYEVAAETKSRWSIVEEAPPDPVLDGLTEKFAKDPNSHKVNLGIGTYKNDNNEPIVLPSVRQVDKEIAEANLNKEYASIAGMPMVRKLGFELAFGEDHPMVDYEQCVVVQTLSGTGALRLAGDFLKKYHHTNDIWIHDVSWPNHPHVFRSAGLGVNTYRYYDPKTCRLNLKGIIEDLQQLVPTGAAVLFQVVGHNPTGVDPTDDEWREIAKTMKKRKQLPIFDLCYQGFGSGDMVKDRFAMQHFAEVGLTPMICQSFSKNMGLYGERVGTFIVICEDQEEARRVLTQVKLLIRGNYSNPPIHGGRIVERILGDPKMKKQWFDEVHELSERLSKIREALVERLKAEGSKRDWSHVTTQRGMFCYTGLTEKECEKLTKEFSIHLQPTGRIAVTGLNSTNVNYVAKAIHEVTKNN